MRTTHVVRGDEVAAQPAVPPAAVPALGFRIPKYVHIGPLMKMDGTSKAQVSQAQGPGACPDILQGRGLPGSRRVRICHDAAELQLRGLAQGQSHGFLGRLQILLQKLNPAGALFDYAKLCDVSKNEIARLDAAEVYDLALEYAKEFDPDFAAALESDPEYARSILAIGRGGRSRART